MIIISTEPFGKTSKEEEAYLYTLENSKGTIVKISDYGATVVSIILLDARGNRTDVVLGYDDVCTYENNHGCFGATIGRIANRTAGAQFMIERETYYLEVNNNNMNNLHSSENNGYHKRLWKVIEYSKNTINLQIISQDGDQGLPGTAVINVSYMLRDDNGLEIRYRVDTDKKTVVNMTNHTYFNLAGHNSGSIVDTVLELKAECFTPCDEFQIPTGEIKPVEGTPMDFRLPTRIGHRINDEDEQLLIAGGYDHNFMLKQDKGVLELAAVAFCEYSGIKMEVYTDLPGIQLYTGNYIEDLVGKSSARYSQNHGFCLETQYFPNCVNESNFVSPYVQPEEPYVSMTIYKFSLC